VYIRIELDKSVNRDEGSYQLCHVYDKLFAAAATSTVCGKKCIPRSFFAIFLATARIFLHEITHIYYTHLLCIHSYVKLLKSTVLFLIMTELLNFLGDHVFISDVHEIFAERKTYHVL